MCNHRHSEDRSVGRPQSFLLLPLPTEPHRDPTQCHTTTTRSLVPRGHHAEPWAGLSPQHPGWAAPPGLGPPLSVDCTCPHSPPKGKALLSLGDRTQEGAACLQVVLCHLLRHGCEESCHGIHQEAHDSPAGISTTRDRRPHWCLARTRGSVPELRRQAQS